MIVLSIRTKGVEMGTRNGLYYAIIHDHEKHTNRMVMVMDDEFKEFRKKHANTRIRDEWDYSYCPKCGYKMQLVDLDRPDYYECVECKR